MDRAVRRTQYYHRRLSKIVRVRTRPDLRTWQIMGIIHARTFLPILLAALMPRVSINLQMSTWMQGDQGASIC